MKNYRNASRWTVLFLATGFLALSASSGATPTPVESGWEGINAKEGIAVYSKDIEGSPLVAFRGVGVIDAPVAKVMSVLYDSSRKTEWVNRAVEARDVRQISPYERIEYNHSATPWPLKDRDFVFNAKVEIDEPGKFLTLTIRSVDKASMPENDCCVRANLIESRYVVRPVEGGLKTEVDVQIQIDPKGSIPKWFANIVQKSWPRKTLEASAQAARTDVAEHPLTRKSSKRTNNNTRHGKSSGGFEAVVSVYTDDSNG